MRRHASPRRPASVPPPPETQLTQLGGAALLLVPLALLMLSHPVPLAVFHVCLAGAYLPEAAARPHRALVILLLLAIAVFGVRALRA